MCCFVCLRSDLKLDLLFDLWGGCASSAFRNFVLDFPPMTRPLRPQFEMMSNFKCLPFKSHVAQTINSCSFPILYPLSPPCGIATCVYCSIRSTTYLGESPSSIPPLANTRVKDTSEPNFIFPHDRSQPLLAGRVHFHSLLSLASSPTVTLAHYATSKPALPWPVWPSVSSWRTTCVTLTSSQNKEEPNDESNVAWLPQDSPANPIPTRFLRS